MTKLTVWLDGDDPISGRVASGRVVTPFVGWLGLLRAVSLAAGSALSRDPGSGAGDRSARRQAELGEDV